MIFTMQQHSLEISRKHAFATATTKEVLKIANKENKGNIHGQI